jgi:hypothetical protein
MGLAANAAALIGRKMSGFTGGQLSNVQTGAKSGARILSSKNYPLQSGEMLTSRLAS